MSKYKYYFRKPRSEITKDIFKCLAVAGAICVAGTSPYFLLNLLRGRKQWQRHKRNNFYHTFYRLRKAGFIITKKINNQIYVSLTEEGRKKAGRLQIDALEIKRPPKWDHKWRLVLFDIAQLKKFYREAFRGKLKELGFHPLQKSIWIHPFNCSDEIKVLKEFFGLTDKEVRLITTDNIGEDSFLRDIFKV